MKVLYISNFRDGTEKAQAAINYVLALDTVEDIEVVPRHIKLNGVASEVPERIEELEQKSAKHPDVIIQHIPPDLMEYCGKVKKNIGIYSSTTSHFRPSGWAANLNLMDELIVPNNQMITAARKSGVTTKISMVPQATDINKYCQSYESLRLFDDQENKFIFYTIVEFNCLHNIISLLIAFHSEFRSEEPIELVIKTTDNIKDLENVCSEVKKNLKLGNGATGPKREKVVGGHWSQENMMRLHSSCSCFVSAAYGEANMTATLDALGMGKTPVVGRHTGFLDYVDDEVGWLVNSIEEPVFATNGDNNYFPCLCTSYENWWAISIIDLMKKMREVYNNKSLRVKKGTEAMRKVYEFSYENIGQIIKGHLNV